MYQATLRLFSFSCVALLYGWNLIGLCAGMCLQLEDSVSSRSCCLQMCLRCVSLFFTEEPIIRVNQNPSVKE